MANFPFFSKDVFVFRFTGWKCDIFRIYYTNKPVKCQSLAIENRGINPLYLCIIKEAVRLGIWLKYAGEREYSYIASAVMEVMSGDGQKRLSVDIF